MKHFKLFILSFCLAMLLSACCRSLYVKVLEIEYPGLEDSTDNISVIAFLTERSDFSQITGKAVLDEFKNGEFQTNLTFNDEKPQNYIVHVVPGFVYFDSIDNYTKLYTDTISNISFDKRGCRNFKNFSYEFNGVRRTDDMVVID